MHFGHGAPAVAPKYWFWENARKIDGAVKADTRTHLSPNEMRLQVTAPAIYPNSFSCIAFASGTG